MSGNTKKLYARRSLGRRPFARSFAKSLSLPRGSWHEGYSQAGAELPSALDCSSPDPVGVRIEFSLQGGRRWSAEAVCGPCELCPRQGSGKVINRLKSSQSASTFVEPPDQHTLSPENNREAGVIFLFPLWPLYSALPRNGNMIYRPTSTSPSYPTPPHPLSTPHLHIPFLPHPDRKSVV